MSVSYDLMVMMDSWMSLLWLGVVGEMTSSSRSITRGCSSGCGRSRGRASHPIPFLVHLGDPIQEKARGDDSVKQHAEIEGPVTRDLVKEILARLPLHDRAHHLEHGDRDRSMSPRGRNLESRRWSSQSI